MRPDHQRLDWPFAYQPENGGYKKGRIRSVNVCHLSDDEAGQGHPGDGADQLHGGAVVDVAVSHCELLGLGFVFVH